MFHKKALHSVQYQILCQCLQDWSWVSSSQITYGHASKHQLRFSERKVAVCCWVFWRILPWAGLQKYRRKLIICLQISISLTKCFINNIILPRNMDKKVVKHTLCQLRLFFCAGGFGCSLQYCISRHLDNNLPSNHVCSWRKILKRHGTLSMDCCYLHCSNRLTVECWAALQQGLMLCRVPLKIL